jgi:hypothetical protein
VRHSKDYVDIIFTYADNWIFRITISSITLKVNQLRLIQSLTKSNKAAPFKEKQADNILNKLLTSKVGERELLQVMTRHHNARD